MSFVILVIDKESYEIVDVVGTRHGAFRDSEALQEAMQMLADEGDDRYIYEERQVGPVGTYLEG